MSKTKRAKRKKLPPNTKVQARGDVSLATPRWDHGATGPANRIGLVVEERGDVDPDTGKVRNPNGITGVSRYDMLKVYHKRGLLSDRHYTAGEALRNAWEATLRSKGAGMAGDRVDSTSKPDATIDIHVDRISKLASFTRLIPATDREIIMAVACEERPVSHLSQYRGLNHAKGVDHMKAAFERFADKMERRA